MTELSAEALGGVPEVDAAFEALNTVQWKLDMATDPVQRAEVIKEGDEAENAIILAVRDAVLSAHRERVVSLTEEQVVEEAAKAMWAWQFRNIPGVTWETIVGGSEKDRDLWREFARAAAPLLLGPEVAKREAVEKELADLKENEADETKYWSEERDALRSRLAAVERERDEAWEAVKANEADGIAYGKLMVEMAAVEEAVREVCPSNLTTGVAEEFAYVCHNEDGEPIVEAATLPEAIQGIISAWHKGAEQYAAAEASGAKMREAVAPALADLDTLIDLLFLTPGEIELSVGYKARLDAARAALGREG